MGSNAPLKVLAITPSAGAREEISKHLRGLPHEVLLSADLGAVRAALAASPDAVVVAFPSGNTPFAALVSALAPAAAIVVVGPPLAEGGGAASAGAGLASPAEAVEVGASDYLFTPLAPGQLALTLELAVRRRRERLVDEERVQGYLRQIEAVVEQAPVPMFLKGREGRYRLANLATHRYMGLPAGSMIGMTDADFLPPETVEHVAASDRIVLSGEGTWEGERTFHVGGALKTFLSTKLPFLDEAGRIIGIFGVATDITEQRMNEAVRTSAMLEQRRLVEALQNSRAETVDRLVRALHERDAASGSHVSRMAEVAAWLSRLVGFDHDRAMLLRAAAPMHDIGKIAVPDEILRKPGPLTPGQRCEMERHTRVGFEILDGSGSTAIALGATIALTHHEDWDGNGYPRGLRGEEIPIEGRICALADVFDALLSDRPYRPAMEVDRAKMAIEVQRGRRFDPEITDALLMHWDEAIEVRAAAAGELIEASASRV